MKKIVIIILSIMGLLSGCMATMPKDAVTQEVITEPKVLFAEKKANLDEIEKYDDSECYQFPEKVTSFSMFEKMGSTAFIGRIDGYPVDTEYVWVKGPYKNFFSWPKTTSKVYIHLVDRDCLNAFGCNWDIPEDMCIKKHGTALSKEQKYWRGDDRAVVELVTKRKLTTNERKELLNKKQQELTEEYNKYNKHYQSILQKWKEESSAVSFCNDIKAEWMERECRFPISNYECANLANPFAECYKQGFIKLSPEYIRAIS